MSTGPEKYALKLPLAASSVGGISGSVFPQQLCNCVGPQNGEPLCRCQMAKVTIKDGRYVMPERDLGPAI